jgi:hypothetical protein
MRDNTSEGAAYQGLNFSSLEEDRIKASDTIDRCL